MGTGHWGNWSSKRTVERRSRESCGVASEPADAIRRPWSSVKWQSRWSCVQTESWEEGSNCHVVDLLQLQAPPAFSIQLFVSAEQGLDVAPLERDDHIPVGEQLLSNRTRYSNVDLWPFTLVKTCCNIFIWGCFFVFCCRPFQGLIPKPGENNLFSASNPDNHSVLYPDHPVLI